MTFHVWKVSAMATTLGGVLLAAALPWLMPAIFGTRYSPAVWPAEIGIGAVLLTGQAVILENALNGRGHTFVSTVSVGAFSFCSLFGTMWLGPRFGAVGAAIAAVVGAACRITIAFAWYSARIQKPRWRDFIVGRDEWNQLVWKVKAKVARARVSG